MKKGLILGLAAVAGVGVARAEYSVSTDITLASDYIFRGLQLAENTLHPSIEVSSDNYYLGYWGAFPINNVSSKGWIDEYDFYAGYNFELGEKSSLDAGLTYYYYTQADASLEGYIGYSGDFDGVTPSVYVYYDIDLEVLTIQGSMGYSVPLESVGSTLDLSATFGIVDPDEGDSYSYYGASAVIPFKLNDNATISFGLHYSKNDADLVDALGKKLDDSFLYATIGLTVGF